MNVERNTNKITTDPFLKWAGGKRWLVSRHKDLFPKSFNRYIEPFLGSGAVFFHVNPTHGIIADKNEELIDTYTAIKNDWIKVVTLLHQHQNYHCKDYYYKIRSEMPFSLHEKAARFIYLNRTCWNGLYRVNKSNAFNVPIGTKNKVIYESDNFEFIAKSLSNINIYVSDFENIIDLANNNDFIFIDPPYTVKHNNNGFIKYNQSIFSWNDQIRLRDSIIRAVRRGAKVLLTNAAHDTVEALYNNELFCIKRLTRHSVLAASREDRKPCEELIVCGNYGGDA